MNKILQMMCSAGLVAGMLVAGGCGGGGGGGDDAVPVTDLTITKTHTGNFSQGQNDAKYTVTVKNSGTLASTGTLVTVKDTVPAGLTLRNLSGSGWSCDLTTATCTRTDILAAGVSYPAITVSVDVANTAATTVTNSVTVSGGGDAVTTNNSASDATVVNVNTSVQVSAGRAEPYDASASALTFEIHPTSSFTYNITKFAAGDRLVFDAGTSIEVKQVDKINEPVDNTIDVIGSLNGQDVTIHLTGIDAAADALVYGYNSFNTVFGASSLMPAQ